jgi:hypothetical protein
VHWHLRKFEGRPDAWSGLPVFLGKSGRLVCGGFGFAEFRNDAELLHKAQGVPVDPALRHLAASEASDAYPGDVELFPRWCNPAEIASMGTLTGPTGYHCFAFGN